MKIYNLNATHHLFEKAKSLKQAHDSWRAIYFNFSSNRDTCSDGLRTHYVVKIIKELLAEHDGFIYLCEDRDIFILFQGAAKPIIEALGEYFVDLVNERRQSHPQDDLATVFDLSAHWQFFFDLCQKKMLQAQAEPALTPQSAGAATFKSIEPDTKQFEASALKRQERRRLLVLVVEDDVFTRKLVTSVIKGNFDVIEAGSGEEAMEAYCLHAPDMVFLDIELPDTNGQLILQKLIALDPVAFIVMLSASSFKENILAALEVGAQGFVTKPFAKEKLMHYLNLRDGLRHGRTPVPSPHRIPVQETRL